MAYPSSYQRSTVASVPLHSIPVKESMLRVSNFKRTLVPTNFRKIQQRSGSALRFKDFLLGTTLAHFMCAAMSSEYRINENSRFILTEGDLTHFSGDAIVNAANERMLGGGGVDGAIHRAAGPRLYDECLTVPQVSRGVRCPTGQARITKGYNLPAKYVIHTVGPIYESKDESAPLLADAYRSSLHVANEHELSRVGFPAISTGVFGYPSDEAAEVCVKVVAEAVGKVQEVHFVLFGKPMLKVFQNAAEKQFGPPATPAPATPQGRADDEL